MRTKKGLGTPEIVIGVTLVALIAVGIVFGGGGGSGDGPASRGASAVVAKVATIARRDEAIRGLRFTHIPKPVLVTPDETQREDLADLDRTYPAAQRAADSETLELLGLVPPGTDLRALEGNIASQQIAGYYDTHRKGLAIVEGAASDNGIATEITLSHELNHALEDQRFHLRDDLSGSGGDDAGSAYTALVEGTATEVMTRYAQRYISTLGALGSAIGALGSGAGATDGIPRYVQRSLEFSYFAGQRFVERLYAAGGGSWRLVNRALAGRPPVSTEQVMHPEKYLANQRPLPVVLPPATASLGPGWRRASAGALGEFDTLQLFELALGDGAATSAAAGWGGGRYELWERTPRPAGCASPCRTADALVAAWRWDTPADASQAYAALGAYAKKLGGAHAVTHGAGSGVTALAIAPTRALAARLAASASATPKHS